MIATDPNAVTFVSRVTLAIVSTRSRSVWSTEGILVAKVARAGVTRLKTARYLSSVDKRMAEISFLDVNRHLVLNGLDRVDHAIPLSRAGMTIVGIIIKVDLVQSAAENGCTGELCPFGAKKNHPQGRKSSVGRFHVDFRLFLCRVDQKEIYEPCLCFPLRIKFAFEPPLEGHAAHLS
jgi:hypothetical protein